MEAFMKRVIKVFKLLIAVLFSVAVFDSAILEVNALNATLVWGEEIYYPSYLGNWSTKKCYINGSLAYCLQASKNTPPEGQYTTGIISNNEALLKVLYYGYGGPEDVLEMIRQERQKTINICILMLWLHMHIREIFMEEKTGMI